MKTKIVLMVALLAVMLVVAVNGCASAVGTGADQGQGGESGEASHSESGEPGESGIYYARDETLDEVQSGARLILSYDAQTNTFTGTVENTTSNVLSLVQVEMHLDNGVELGPTTPTDLAPGQMIDVSLQATDASFGRFTAHPEVGSDAESEGGGEHGSGGEGDSAGGEGGGEHGGGGESGD